MVVSQCGNGAPIPDPQWLIHLLGDGFGCILLPVGILSMLKQYPAVIAVPGLEQHYPYPTYPVPAKTYDMWDQNIRDSERHVYIPQKTLNPLTFSPPTPQCLAAARKPNPRS